MISGQPRHLLIVARLVRSQIVCAKATGVALAAMMCAAAAPAAAAPIFFDVGGSNLTSSIQGTVDNFRAALGNPNNGNAAGPLLSGRREINWDGGGDTNTVSGPTLTAFQNIRGGLFNTPGTGTIQAPPASATAGVGLDDFFNNATYGAIFTTFSSPRDFTPIGSNIIDATFFIPTGVGGAAGPPATVRGFGAVFTDVDLAGSTTLQYFDRNGNLLASQSVLPGTVANASLSFAGVVFNAGEEIFRVRITSGNTPLATGVNDGGGIDLVVMDDFLYAEPRAIPAPAALLLLGVALLGLAAFSRFRMGKA